MTSKRCPTALKIEFACYMGTIPNWALKGAIREKLAEERITVATMANEGKRYGCFINSHTARTLAA
jgi:hypothetical protein